MSITADLLKSKIVENIAGTSVCECVDESDGCGAKWEITIVSTSFEGIPKLKQHRLVHKAIEKEREQIHALTLKTSAPSKP